MRDKYLLKEIYEEELCEIVDSFPRYEINTISTYVQALKLFLSYLCSNGISIECLSVEDVESFFKWKYSTGSSSVTLKSYFTNINRFFLETRTPFCFKPSQIHLWGEKWKAQGVPTDWPLRKLEIEINYTSGAQEVCDVVRKCHPRS